MQTTQQARFSPLCSAVAFKLNEGVSMKIDSRIVGDVHFLNCSGRITLGEGTMSVRTAVGDILKRLSLESKTAHSASTGPE
jgi:hypothetical protein